MIKYCKDCKYSVVQKTSTWMNSCTQPYVIIKNAWALANNNKVGVDCVDERWGWFKPCGIKGKLWKPK